MPGKGRGGKPGPVWEVTVVPDGTAAEAEAAARRAQRLVAEWVRAGVGAGRPAATGARVGVWVGAGRAPAAGADGAAGASGGG